MWFRPAIGTPKAGRDDIIIERKMQMTKAYADYLRDLAERLMKVPAIYNVDQGDVDLLLEIARELEASK